MTGFTGMSKQKNPPAKISDESQSRKRAWVWGYTMGKLVWGRTTVYLQLFGVNISSMVTYFALQIRLGICHRLIRLNSTAPPQGICIL